uniref:Tandem C2 domains, nuclear n=1 Tax=Gouania willdenowi TaxID=441366 RepID=A0A8C5DDX4_GOUWI
MYVTSGAVMECLKNCCKNLTKKKVVEPEAQVITLKIPTKASEACGHPADEGRCLVTEDYLLSKLPPDGREVPFVLPTFRATYVQPTSPQYPNLQPGLQSSARCTYTARKAELMTSNQIPYSSESSLHHHDITEFASPGSTRRDTLRNRTSSPQCSPGTTTQCRQYSITLSGDERELGKVCVRLSYQEAVEQVWITLVQVRLPQSAMPRQKIGIKAIITIPKPVHFKSSIKEYSQNVIFMETFVFALHLQQLHCSALVLRLQTHNPKKRTVAESILSLRQLSSHETEHWLELHPPSKSLVCHSELHLTTCFQPVNGRIQLQILAAQNLPACSSPLTQVFYVKVEMFQSGQVVMKKKTRVIKASGGRCQWAETFHLLLSALDQDCSLLVKLYSRSSIRRKRCLGQTTIQETGKPKEKFLLCFVGVNF